jgi:hypothetical protein
MEAITSSNFRDEMMTRRSTVIVRLGMEFRCRADEFGARVSEEIGTARLPKS